MLKNYSNLLKLLYSFSLQYSVHQVFLTTITQIINYTSLLTVIKANIKIQLTFNPVSGEAAGWVYELKPSLHVTASVH